MMPTCPAPLSGINLNSLSERGRFRVELNVVLHRDSYGLVKLIWIREKRDMFGAAIVRPSYHDPYVHIPLPTRVQHESYGYIQRVDASCD